MSLKTTKSLQKRSGEKRDKTILISWCFLFAMSKALLKFCLFVHITRTKQKSRRGRDDRSCKMSWWKKNTLVDHDGIKFHTTQRHRSPSQLPFKLPKQYTKFKCEQIFPFISPLKSFPRIFLFALQSTNFFNFPTLPVPFIWTLAHCLVTRLVSTQRTEWKDDFFSWREEDILSLENGKQ